MLTYLSASLPDTSWPFWPHFWLLSVSILASFAVGAGIILESPKYSAAIHLVAALLVLGGIAVESLCTVILFVIDEGISGAQQSLIADQQKQIIRLTTPRKFNSGAIRRVEDNVCQFGPQPFDRVYGVYDEILFIGQLANIWETCKWHDVQLTNRADAEEAATGIAGIRLWYPPEHTVDFADVSNAFAKALKNGGIEAIAEPLPKDKKLPNAAIHFILGSRP
jgi:hypothetical protein